MNIIRNQDVQQIEIKQIIEKYDAFIIDLWGVIHDGIRPYPGVVECLHHLIFLNKSIIFLSNTPRPAPVVMDKLTSFGIKVTDDMVLTSGDMVRNQLIHFNDPTFNNLGKCFYHLGAHRNSDILAEIPANLTQQLENANFILLTAYLDEGEDLNQYDDLLLKAAFLKIPIICANPDKAVIHGNKTRYCAGVLAEKYEKMGGIVYYYGKPYLGIYEVAFNRLRQKGIYNKSKILMIGDTLETDIVGANSSSIDSALVLSGNVDLLFTKAKDNDPNILCTQFLSDLFKKTNIAPTWILPNFSLTGENIG